VTNDVPRRTVGVRVLAGVLALVGGLVGMLAGALVSPGPASAGLGLGDAAAYRGRYFGAAVLANRLTDPAYTTILNREFSSVTPENVLEWDAIEPARGQFVFTLADRVVGHAVEQRMRVHGTALVSPRANNLLWVTVVPPAEMRAVMNDHIGAAMRHYGGVISTWNVVSEAFNENGTLRPSMFQRHIGPGYVEEAFRAARAADPAARLCYNDFNIEDLASLKTQAVYEMVRDFKARGVPIDCVGLQSHFGAPNAVPDGYRQTIAAFAALGVDVELSELDIPGSGDQQAADYRRAVQSCLAVRRCTGITVWGVRDNDSWRPNLTPLLFDAAGARKPAYFAVLRALTRR
jgi:endo-1,4-beta-xylanase